MKLLKTIQLKLFSACMDVPHGVEESLLMAVENAGGILHTS